MITAFIIIYNIFRINKTKYSWLNPDYPEGITTGVIGVIVDAITIIFLISLI